MFGFNKNKKDDDKKVEITETGNPEAASTELVKDAVVPGPKTEKTTKKPGFGQKIKDAAMDKMLQKQLANLPPQQKEIMMTAIKNNPEFFEKIAKETEALVKSGKNQMAASMEVMRKYQGEFQKIMMGK